MPELAERAGVGVGTLYRAFPDKDHLLGAVMAERLRWLAGEIEVAIAGGRPVERRSPTSSGRAPPCTSRTAPFTSACARALELPEVREARGHTLDGFQRLIERAQAAGAMRADVVAEDIPMLMAGVGLSRVAGTGRRQWERHLAVVIDGLRAEGAHPLPSKPLSRAQLDAIVRELPCPR